MTYSVPVALCTTHSCQECGLKGQEFPTKAKKRIDMHSLIWIPNRIKTCSWERFWCFVNVAAMVIETTVLPTPGLCVYMCVRACGGRDGEGKGVDVSRFHSNHFHGLNISYNVGLGQDKCLLYMCEYLNKNFFRLW